MRLWHPHWRYRNTTLLALSFILLLYMAGTPAAQSLINSIGSLGYLGAFLTGIFFVCTFTVAPAAVVLYHLAEGIHPLTMAVFAGAGGVIGDFLIFRFLKDGVLEELKPLYLRWGGGHVSALFHTPIFAWTLPVIGSLIIASPLPDEIGVSLLGLSNMRTWKFVLLTFALDAAGIFIIVTLARM